MLSDKPLRVRGDEMNRTKCWQVDAFTDRAFAGNPAAVCWLEQEADPSWMQAVAAEMNLAETAFVLKLGDHYWLRWFTPKVEVDLCGHATLASAHVLWSEGIHPAVEPIRFKTRSGTLTCTADEGLIHMDFPATPATVSTPPPGLLEALGISAAHVARSQFDYLVAVDEPTTVRTAAPDFRKLAEVPTRGVMITSCSDEPRYDFLSRFFAPAVGLDVDPVKGSAHCCLGPYWSGILGRKELIGFQASPRGGAVHVRVQDARVVLGGRAVTVLRGELL